MSQQTRYNENQPGFLASKPIGTSMYAGMPPVKQLSQPIKKVMETTTTRSVLADITHNNQMPSKMMDPSQQLKKQPLGSTYARPLHSTRSFMSDDVMLDEEPHTPPPPPQHVNIDPKITEFLMKKKAALVDPTMEPHEIDDPQLCAVYSNDIHQHLRIRERQTRPNPQYMARQSDINPKMREILIDWLVEVHLKFKLRQETLYLTINIIDRFLEHRAVARSKLQLVGCTAMLIASKYEEIYAPEVQDFVYVADRAYTREHILAMEGIMLNVLEFYITAPYPIRFAERYLRILKCTDEFASMVNYLIELTLQEYKCIQYLPSVIAASSISLALHLSGREAWPEALKNMTGYTEADINACVMDLWAIAAKDSPKYRAVRKKYQSSRFHGVAKTIINPPPTQAQPTNM